ncbi:hypothetical protein AX774_g6087 [Zancudomyces culisetae]|uniref:Uncharacterized protein n=1 Tax=Zancudomyces culisetae TaxID=1213189 RepID=A0A1R1PHL8_ZANCU|nr:hypothetical protein AX774_g6087 [Zancudomyces culisetae]|eukprot:OMH80474.1 hypothetical protein AX774_g6087 [Zancudomyces culisetae]
MDIFSGLPPPTKKDKNSIDIFGDGKIAGYLIFGFNHMRPQKVKPLLGATAKSVGNPRHNPLASDDEEITQNGDSGPSGNKPDTQDSAGAIKRPVEELTSFRSSNSKHSEIKDVRPSYRTGGASGKTVPALWTERDIDIVPAETKVSDIVPLTRKEPTRTSFNLSEYLPSIDNKRGFNPNHPQKGKKYSTERSSIISEKFDENELYNPAKPNSYQQYKEWEHEKRKRELILYMKHRENRDKRDARRNRDYSSSYSQSSRSESYDSDKSYSSSGSRGGGGAYRRDRRYSRIDPESDYSTDAENNRNEHISEYASSHSAKEDRFDDNPTNDHRYKAQLLNAETGEEAYLARLRMSQHDSK